jgi:3-oxoacyl-[acyl-carrier protein] reductase
MNDFSGKIILVTASSNGIGLGIAKAFRDTGGTVHITGTRASVADYEHSLEGFIYHQADLSNIDARAKLHAEVGPIDVLVNNFGGSNHDEYSIEGFRRSLEDNLGTSMELALLYVDDLQERGGCIVNIGSASSHLALRETPGYTAGKSGVWGLTRALADKWASKGIRVNMIAPGFIFTRATEKMRVDKDREKRMIATVPMRRWGQPDELGGAALFLASPGASYVTGISLAVDGGLLVR